MEDRAAIRDLPIYIVVRGCGEGNDQPTEEREKTAASARSA
jgi:hypothetical protein